MISGEYRTELPDGRVQIVTYHADHGNIDIKTTIETI